MTIGTSKSYCLVDAKSITKHRHHTHACEKRDIHSNLLFLDDTLVLFTLFLMMFVLYEIDLCEVASMAHDTSADGSLTVFS
mmetsp:Transcript_12139/g.26586  ORF Transcript_12139/g.26586 Transcript_12139/m.26586 type:complete len:81 (+) Transcript_12139:287-529(+)